MIPIMWTLVLHFYLPTCLLWFFSPFLSQVSLARTFIVSFAYLPPSTLLLCRQCHWLRSSFSHSPHTHAGTRSSHSPPKTTWIWWVRAPHAWQWLWCTLFFWASTMMYTCARNQALTLTHTDHVPNGSGGSPMPSSTNERYRGGDWIHGAYGGRGQIHGGGRQVREISGGEMTPLSSWDLGWWQLVARGKCVVAPRELVRGSAWWFRSCHPWPMNVWAGILWQVRAAYGSEAM